MSEGNKRDEPTAAKRQEFGAHQRVLVEGYISSRVGQRVDAVEALLAERDRYREAIEAAMDALAVKGLPYQILHDALEPKS